MKIGLDTPAASPAGTYSQHLAKILKRHAPEHEYIVEDKAYKAVDIYHGFRSVPFSVRRRNVPSVMTVANLNFLRYPHLFPLPQRPFVLWYYRRTLRTASRVITVNTPARDYLAEELSIDRRKIEVVMPLAALAPQPAPPEAELEAVRHKYALPEHFILMLGTVEERHNHHAVFEAVLAAELPVGIVVCGRRTAYSDRLLALARSRHIATRVDFLYEPAREDLPALFRLARAFVYVPDAQVEASIIPVVEALRCELPMVLSNTPTNREAAGDAALYVRPHSVGELAAALEHTLFDEDYRSAMRARCRRRAELFSEFAVARRLMDIYSSL